MSDVFRQQKALKNSNGDEYQAGDVWFVDQNNDGVIDESDKVSLGSPFTPKRDVPCLTAKTRSIP